MSLSFSVAETDYSESNLRETRFLLVRNSQLQELRAADHITSIAQDQRLR